MYEHGRFRFQYLLMGTFIGLGVLMMGWSVTGVQQRLGPYAWIVALAAGIAVTALLTIYDPDASTRERASRVLREVEDIPTNNVLIEFLAAKADAEIRSQGAFSEANAFVSLVGTIGLAFIKLIPSRNDMLNTLENFAVYILATVYVAILVKGVYRSIQSRALKDVVMRRDALQMRLAHPAGWRKAVIKCVRQALWGPKRPNEIT